MNKEVVHVAPEGVGVLLEGQHSAGVREVAEGRGESDGAVHELGQGLGEDVHGGDLGAEEDAQVPVDQGQVDRGPGAAGEALDKVSAGSRWEDDGLPFIDSEAGGAAKVVDQLHHPPQAGALVKKFCMFIQNSV